MTANASAAAPVAAPNVKVTGRRILALLIDGILLGIVFGVLSVLFGSASASGGQASASLSGVSSLIFFVIGVLYWVLMEGYLGQTLGKMALGIKVVRADDGKVPGVGKAFIRNLLRIVDELPVFYLVGFIAILASSKNQRLGDMAAGTLVVRK